MAVYTAHAPAGTTAQTLSDGDAVIFVKDGFAWLALIAPMIWLLWHRCWLAFLAVMAMAVGIAVATEMLPQYGDAIGIIGVLLSLFVALEANGWRRWSLGRKGYDMLGVASGANRADCERRFFDKWVAQSARTTMVRPASAGQAMAAGAQGIVGLFPERGR